LRAQILIALEEFEPAIAPLEVALAKQPDHPDALLHHMRALGQPGDPVRGEARPVQRGRPEARGLHRL
jgi:hypothetical protein